MSKQIMVHMTVFTSPNGVDNWTPTKLEDLPEWVLDPDIMGRLAHGEECTNSAFGAAWYRAIVTDEQIDPPLLPPIAKAVQSAVN